MTTAISGLFDVQSGSQGSASSSRAGDQIAAAVTAMARAAATAAVQSAMTAGNGTAEPVVLSSPNLNMTVNVQIETIRFVTSR